MTNVLMTRGSWDTEIYNHLDTLGANVRILADSALVHRGVQWADRVLIPGGADIHPHYYGEAVRYATPTAPERDALESLLVDATLHSRKPLMGICRGHQMITVMAGGSLWQDLLLDTGHKHKHAYHPVRLRGKSKLARWLGETTHVNSYHHQAVRLLPRGWQVAATSPDGVIEAIEHPHRKVISVQWHPEAMYSLDAWRLFSTFMSL